MIGIYKIVNRCNNKVYIGSSNNIAKRFNQHKWHLRSNVHDNDYLQKSWNKYGETSFEFETVELLDSEDDLLIREDYYIEQYKSMERKFGYNMKTAERGKHSRETKDKIGIAHKNKIVSAETRRKISAANTGKKASTSTKEKLSAIHKGKRTGNKHPLYGKHHSEETKKRMSLSRIGRKTSETTKEKLRLANLGINNPNYGKHPSAETRIKMSHANIGENNPMFSRRLCGEDNGFFGRNHSEESKMKMSCSKKSAYIGEGNPFFGQNHTDETKRKISLSHNKWVMQYSKSGDLIKRYECLYDVFEENPEFSSRSLVSAISKQQTYKGSRWEYLDK